MQSLLRTLTCFVVSAAGQLVFAEEADVKWHVEAAGVRYVDADNRAARRLYERLGFRVIAESVCYSVPGG